MSQDKTNTIKDNHVTMQNQRKTLSRRSSNHSYSKIIKRRKSSGQINRILPSNDIFLPREYIKCEKSELITIISRMLSSIVSINDQRTSLDVKYLNSQNLTRFHSRSPPQISIYNYLIRLSHYSSLENCVLIATVYYIDLLTLQYPSFALNSLTVHRFLLTATTIASKALCDSFCSNNHYAKVGGVNIVELNLLEVEFLKWVNYRVVPRDFNYDSYCERKNSIGSLEIFQENALKFGISTAEKILDLYYEKMIGLVGGFDKANPDKTEKINIGHNDDMIYRLESVDIEYPLSASSSLSSDDTYESGLDDNLKFTVTDAINNNNNANNNSSDKQIIDNSGKLNISGDNLNNHDKKNDENTQFDSNKTDSNYVLLAKTSSSPNFIKTS